MPATGVRQLSIFVILIQGSHPPRGPWGARRSRSRGRRQRRTGGPLRREQGTPRPVRALRTAGSDHLPGTDHTQHLRASAAAATGLVLACSRMACTRSDASSHPSSVYGPVPLSSAMLRVLCSIHHCLWQSTLVMALDLVALVFEPAQGHHLAEQLHRGAGERDEAGSGRRCGCYEPAAVAFSLGATLNSPLTTPRSSTTRRRVSPIRA